MLNVGFGDMGIEEHVRTLASLRCWIKARPDEYLLLRSADDVADLVVGVHAGKPVYLGLCTDANDVLRLKPQNLLLNLPLAAEVQSHLDNNAAISRTRRRAQQLLDSIAAKLSASGWYSSQWLDEVLAQLPERFDRACDRWRQLYRAAMAQREREHKRENDNSLSPKHKAEARRFRHEAESQRDLLLNQDTSGSPQSDFYSYRYFASEGFLPGYNFPRLPLSAFIPGRAGSRDQEYLNRPRFLAISEFGPKSLVYHEGQRYQVDRVLLPPSESDSRLVVGEAKQCHACGYLHPIGGAANPDRCEYCEAELPTPIQHLLKLTNVRTRRRERISSDEDERQKQGFDVRTAFRFQRSGISGTFSRSDVSLAGSPLATLTFGRSAELWRINFGWFRQQERNRLGFYINEQTGEWMGDPDRQEERADGPQVSRVIPYVTDTRNALLFEPLGDMPLDRFASLQAALRWSSETFRRRSVGESSDIDRTATGATSIFYSSPSTARPDARCPRQASFATTATAIRAGLITVGTEMAGAGQVSIEALALCRRGVRGVLAHLGVLDPALAGGAAHKAEPGPLLSLDGPDAHVFAPVEGVFEPFHPLGAAVSAGEPAGAVHFPWDPAREPEKLAYGVSGVLYARRQQGHVRPGNCCLVVASRYRGTLP
jgi:hypothetical protein